MKIDFDNLTFEEFERISNDALSINKELIDDELQNHPTSFSYFGGLLNKYRYMFERTQTDFEATCSLLKNQKYIEGKNSAKKYTVDYLENYLKSLPEYVSGKKQLLDIEEKLGYLQTLAKAFEHKKDMLVQLSANRRSESKIYG